MSRRARALLPLVVLAQLAAALPGGPVARVAAAEYTLVTSATYEIRPDAGEIGVDVDITFTNTTPDPEGQFSVFEELKLAIHDAAGNVTATDDDGELEVGVAVENEVNVATITLRDDLRFEESVELELQYTLADGADPQMRVRPSVVVFPAWSFGTSSQVRVTVPSGYEVRVDGDPLTDEGGTLVSGPIEDPTQWLALVTATRPGDYVEVHATVPLNGGTADLSVRAFADDEAWGQQTLDLVTRALPLLEREIGLPYPRIGSLTLTEAVSADASGFGETPTTGTEILVAFDQPPFTAIHQIAHVWLSSRLIEARWIREGWASEVAARVAAEVGVDPPYDPAAEAGERQAAAFRLDAWAASADPGAESWAHAASWAFMAELTTAVGADALRTALARVAASVGPYATTEVDREVPTDPAAAPEVPLTSRSFLDHLETVSDVDLASRFAEVVLSEADAALLPARAVARTEFERLVERAAGWGAPDPVRAAMTAWSFEDAQAQIEQASAWLEARDRLLAEMEAAGLSAPDRLQQSYRSFGGGAEAQAELTAEAGVVEAYAATAVQVNGPRTFMQRIGLIGGPDPSQQLTLANGRFAEGDLRGAAEAISEAQRILASSEAGGVVRLISAALVVLVLAVLAVVLFRRRASYTPRP